MKTAIISFGKPMTLEMPDGFNYSIKRRGTTSVAEYEEIIQESRETYARTAAWFLNWAIERGYRQEQVNSSWSNGTTKLQITESGQQEGASLWHIHRNCCATGVLPRGKPVFFSRHP